jgi:hypothetical protein
VSANKEMFADIEALLADMEAGKPFDCSPELRALAKQAAKQAEYDREHPMTEEEAQAWAKRMSWLITEGED